MLPRRPRPRRQEQGRLRPAGRRHRQRARLRRRAEGPHGVVDDDPRQAGRVRAILVSLTAGTVILALKMLAWKMTDSMALASDALESVVNVVAAVFGLGAIIFAGQPADRNHPYGHGKMEYFAAAFEGGLISLAAVLIVWEALQALFAGARPHDLGFGLAVNLGAGALNGLLGWYLLRRGRALGSKALEADGHHVLSDFVTTAGIMAGLLVVMATRVAWLDPAIAVAVGLWLGRTGFRLVRESAAALLDEEDTEMTGRLTSAIDALVKKGVAAHGVITVHGLRAIRAGRTTHVDVHMVVPEYAPVAQAHDAAERFEAALFGTAGLEGEVHAHLDPCRKAYCARCSDEGCPIRTSPFKGYSTLTIEDAIAIEPTL
ncbi:MAG: cation transporter [Elusimicrobia bacterium]|nr:cation transporter [Elusimicrobiota bacterium]